MDNFAGCVQEGVRLLRVPSPAGKMLGLIANTSFHWGVCCVLCAVMPSLIGT